MGFIIDKKLSKERTDVWFTPKEVFKIIDDEFNFTLDAATEPDNPLGLKRFFTKEDNALTKSWKGETVWLNPPYSKSKHFAKKAMEEFLENGTKTVMLIPARIDTKWFHKYVIPYCEVRVVKGRIKFLLRTGVTRYPPFPSVVCIYNGKPNIKVQERGY